MITLVFIRHGATKGNLEKRYIGRTDEPLCDAGIGQALELKAHEFPGEHIFVSPMKRTRQTAELVFPGSEYVIVEGFKEMDFGDFEGKCYSELSGNEDYRIWLNSMCTTPVPNGESVTGFKERCVEAFKSIVRSLPDGSEASFVVHGGVIMAVLEAFAEPKSAFYDNHIKNGEFLVCKYKNGKITIFARDRQGMRL